MARLQETKVDAGRNTQLAHVHEGFDANTTKQASVQPSHINSPFKLNSKPERNKESGEEERKKNCEEVDADLVESNLVQKRIEMFENKSLI